MVDNLLLSYFTSNLFTYFSLFFFFILKNEILNLKSIFHLIALLISLAPGARRHNLVENMVRKIKMALGIGSQANAGYNSNNNASRVNYQPMHQHQQQQQQQQSSMFNTPKRAANLASSSTSSVSSSSSSYYSNSYNDFMTKRK